MLLGPIVLFLEPLQDFPDERQDCVKSWMDFLTIELHRNLSLPVDRDSVLLLKSPILSLFLES